MISGPRQALSDMQQISFMTHAWFVSSIPEWIQQYTQSFIESDKLQKIVDLFMEDYDKRKEEVRILQLFLKHRSPHKVHVTLTCICFLHRRKRSGRRRRLSSNRRMKRAGWKSLKDTRTPRPTLTASQPTRRLYRKRWGRSRGRSSWTSTPGSTETHRKNVSC